MLVPVLRYASNLLLGTLPALVCLYLFFCILFSEVSHQVGHQQEVLHQLTHAGGQLHDFSLYLLP